VRRGSGYDGLIAVDHEDGYYSLHNQKVVVTQEMEKESVQPPEENIFPVPPEPSIQSPRTIWGLPRRRFFIVLGLAITVIVIAIVGGVAGTAVSRNKAAEKDAAAAALPPTSNATGSPVPALLLANSQLATTNWTDGPSPQRSLVFYQDPGGSIILVAWDEQNTTWTSINITDRLFLASDPVEAKLGTPIASTSAGNFHIALFFIDVSNNLVELFTKDPTLQLWRTGDLYKNRIGADPASRLAAHWFFCLPDCAKSNDGADQVRIFFQSEGEQINQYSGTPWRAGGLKQVARPGSAMAGIPFPAASGSMQMRLFYDTGSKLGMMTWKNDTSWRMDSE
jgi:hypothetical protein